MMLSAPHFLQLFCIPFALQCSSQPRTLDGAFPALSELKKFI